MALYERCVCEWLELLAEVRKVEGSKPTRAKTGKLSLFIQHLVSLKAKNSKGSYCCSLNDFD